MYALHRKKINLVSKTFPKSKEGRPKANAELILESIDYVLRTGMSWRQLGEACPYDYRTVHNNFRTWIRHSIFEKAYKTLLRLEGSARRKKYYAIDSTYVKNAYWKKSVR